VAVAAHGSHGSRALVFLVFSPGCFKPSVGGARRFLGASSSVHRRRQPVRTNVAGGALAAVVLRVVWPHCACVLLGCSDAGALPRARVSALGYARRRLHFCHVQLELM